MKIVDFSFCLLALVITSACSETGDNITKINRSFKDEAKNLNLQEVPTADVLEFAQSCFVFDDIMVVQNRINSEKHLLEFVDLKTLQTKRKLFMRGNGPGELINLIVNNSGKYLLVDAFMNEKFARVNVADFLKDEDAEVDFKDYYFDCQGLDLLDDSHFLVVNPYRFINKKLKIKQDVPRFLKITADDDIDEPDMIDAINVNTGGMIINPSANRICYCSRTIPEIEIYDYDLNLIKTVKGPDKMKPAYSVTRQDMVTFSMEVPVAYTQFCYNDEYMYLAYEGRMLNAPDIMRTGGKIEPADTWIFKLDWNGECKESFIIRDKKVQSMSITKDGILYLSCEDAGVLKLYKATL
jgi:hypothetical protein